MTLSQKYYVTKAFEKCSLPLFVKLAFDEVLRWKSYCSKDECVLQATVRAAIASVFEKLEHRHGKLLVSHALSYITQSKNGISDLEMEDLLSLDDVVLNDVYQVGIDILAPGDLKTRKSPGTSCQIKIHFST